MNGSGMYPRAYLISRALEPARCAQINFDNLVRGDPAVAKNPFYVIARHQLDCVVAILEGKPEPEMKP